MIQRAILYVSKNRNEEKKQMLGGGNSSTHTINSVHCTTKCK
ncbi:hypothetical protein EBGED10_52580 [Bacillus sp. GeD10]|nr:hypothetical protein EBGED10_52580 [Bacillus sp. GeD10]